MSAQGAGSRDPAVGHLTALGSALRERGLASTVLTSGFRPRLHVETEMAGSCGWHAAEYAFDDNVVAAPWADGTWWFFYPWAERIAPASQLAEAADKVVELLGPEDEDEDAEAG